MKSFMNPLRKSAAHRAAKAASQAAAGAAGGAPEAAGGYHSEDDARRMRQMAQALLADRRHIALTCADPQTLAHYSRLLVRDLRQFPQVKVLAHLPATSDVMLERFNELLADLPLDLGLDRHAPAERPVKVFVVHDTPRLAPEELALLVRLVNDLPGANLRLVLVQERDLAVTGSLQALGPQVLHWNILPPGVSPAQAANAERARAALRNALQVGHRGATSLDRNAQAAPARTRGPASASTRGPQRTAPALAEVTVRSRAELRPPARGLRASGGAVASPPAAAAKRNWVFLTGGLLLSAALATTLGLWISEHTPSARQAAPSSPGSAQAR